ncbi:hypothetical protein J1N35_006028 [Gossypium stocksii]|uniref:Amino acid transporter transmembrane domain-containing protein n=1 Tax=Gossypium stocksii TaxID=47602 RepID=A0A9D4AJJ5_9ROSI|nr:hypothetical protein J1N35_006028 [Gossypium stocksii]
MNKIYNVLYPDGKEIRSTWFYVAFRALHFFLSHLPSFNSITAISFFAALMSLSYSTIAWVASVRKGVQPTVSYGPRSATPKAQMFDFFG